MRAKNSLIVPIIFILSGILFQLKSLGIFGDFIPDDFLMKLWPLLLAAAALDLLFVERRIIGSVILLFFSAALLSTQFLDGGWNNEVWKLFLKFWPVLLIAFGVDSIFAGRSLINAAVIIIAIVLIVYILLGTLDIPALKQLPFDLTSIIPTSVFNNNQVPVPQQPGPSGLNNPAAPQQNASPITLGSNGQVAIAMPQQNAAQLNLFAASGKISLKAGNASGRLMSGMIQPGMNEQFNQNASVTGRTAAYTLQTQSAGAASDNANWDLQISNQRAVALNAVLNSGYLKADLRGLNLSTVNLENRFGPVDVMVPQTASGRISINVSDGNLRIYIPGGTRITCDISGADHVDYPQRTYALNGGTLSPRSAVQAPISVTVSMSGGTVQIIESE